jgi:hypothetical protein
MFDWPERMKIFSLPLAGQVFGGSAKVTLATTMRSIMAVMMEMVLFMFGGSFPADIGS